MTNRTVKSIARELTQDAASQSEAAIRLHDFVRDSIRFGVTHRFDDATPEQTLEAGVGHCNPQGRLLVALLRAVDIPARMHFVWIRMEVLRGLFPPLFSGWPRAGQHAYVEVEIEGKTRSIDSFILDRPLYRGAVARLRREKRRMGYGTHVDGQVDWDAEGDAFSQLVAPEMLLGDVGPVEDVEAFFRGERYRNLIAGLRISSWLAPGHFLLGGAFEEWANAKVDRVRAGAGATA
jgi:hypothetical protein